MGSDEDGREVLTFIEGDVLADPHWQPGMPGPWPDFARTEEALIAAAKLLCNAHLACSSFSPQPTLWKEHENPLLLAGEIVCHGDVGPHNTVYVDGRPVAFIDWDSIRPNRAVIEFGVAAWNFVPLGTDAYFAASSFRRPPDLPHRLALFATAYGITDRDTVRSALQQAKQRSVEAIRYWPVAPNEAASFLRLVAADLEWFGNVADDLVAELD